MKLKITNYPIPSAHVDIVQTYLPDYLKLKGLVTHERNKYHCLNPNHTDSHPSMCLYRGRQDGKLRLKCQSCGKVFDLFNVVAHLDHIAHFVDIYYHICNLFQIDPDNPTPSKYYQYQQVKEAEPETVQAYLSLSRQNLALTTDKWGLRSISKEIVETYQLGFDSKANAYVIPVGSAGFIQRFIDNTTPKYKRSLGLKSYFLSKSFDNTLPFILTEGEIDALSLLTCGYPNVLALGGIASALDCYEQHFLTSSLPPILAFDLDQVGQDTYQKVCALAEKLGRPKPIDFWSYLVNVPDNTKDINDLLIHHQEYLKQAIDTIKEDFKA